MIPEGILGFPESQRFVLLEHDSEGTPFKWLQSVENASLAFIVMDPNLLISDYVVDFDPEAAELFGTETVNEDFAMMSIVNVPRENPIANDAPTRARRLLCIW